MSEKKNFFELLDPKSALMVGALMGLLALGTIGFIVLGVLALKGGGFSSNGSSSALANAPTPAVAAPAAVDPTPPSGIAKANKPKVELFVMSYCPFGVQMEKAFVPAARLLQDKADIDIKFVSYAMHDLKEVEENTRQYCIQSEQSIKYLDYVECFAATGDYVTCLNATKINEASLAGCVERTNNRFGILAKYEDKDSWLSGRFPEYPIHTSLNEKYGVQGSPTLIINGQEARVNRTAESVKQAICASFNNPPKECEETLENLAYASGFGTAVGSGGSVAAGCGV
jgi:hypothetical protein